MLAINRTDIGLNFSDLTNAAQVFVVDSSGFTQDDFRHLLSSAAAKFDTGKLPLLVYPVEFMAEKNIQFEKTYRCNVISSQYWDDYMRYLRNFLKRAKVR